MATHVLPRAHVWSHGSGRLGPRIDPRIRARTITALGLTAFAVALAAYLVVALGAEGLVVAAIATVLPLFLYWSSVEELRADELGAR